LFHPKLQSSLHSRGLRSFPPEQQGHLSYTAAACAAGTKTGNFWFDAVRNALAIILGILVLVSPLIATLLTATFLMTLIALQAIVVGAMEIYIVVKERALYAHIWPVLLSGVIYVLFGLVVLLFPPAAAGVLVVVAGFLMVFYAAGLFGLAWRLNKKA
jgi:uncharacterized membrane protein HdeD (DUF308 family)